MPYIKLVMSILKVHRLKSYKWNISRKCGAYVNRRLEESPVQKSSLKYFTISVTLKGQYPNSLKCNYISEMVLIEGWYELHIRPI